MSICHTQVVPKIWYVQKTILLLYLFLYTGTFCILLLITKPTRCTNFTNLFFGIKLYMFSTVPLSIIRSFSLYTQQWYMCWQLASRIRTELQFPPDPARSCQQTCMTYTTAVCTLKNSWWWTEELSERCSILFQK
jgi:hypothetical protein